MKTKTKSSLKKSGNKKPVSKKIGKNNKTQQTPTPPVEVTTVPTEIGTETIPKIIGEAEPQSPIPDFAEVPPTVDLIPLPNKN